MTGGVWASADAERFWSDPERVEQFARREPDLRLAALLPRYEVPAYTRVLDLGCAAGRNTELLAGLGFDVFAVDLSAAMAARVRSRLARFFPQDELAHRVRVASMSDLSFLDDESVDLIVALGIYHQAVEDAAWHRAADESVRVLRRGGLWLIAHFAPGTGPIGAPFPRAAGAVYAHDGGAQGHLCFLEPEELDRELARRGVHPVAPTECVEREDDGRRRRTVNGLYGRDEGDGCE